MENEIERESMEWIKRASEYRTLRGKRDLLGYPLGSVEAARLDQLESFFQENLHPSRLVFNQREQQRIGISIVVTFSGRDGSGRGRARDISGDGLYVETEESLPVGARTMVSVMDRTTSEEWQFSAEVVRLGSSGMGLKFLGIPLALRVGHRRPAPTVRRTTVRQAA
jgi:PilZ domain